MVYRVAPTLRVDEAAYLAGLIDGEGTIGLSRRYANERRQLVVSISTTEPELVEWMVRTTGVGKITHKRTSFDKHAPSLNYSVFNRQALALLKQVFPYLRSYKRHRARLALDQYVVVTPRNGKYSVMLSSRREAFQRCFLDMTAHAGFPQTRQGGR